MIQELLFKGKPAIVKKRGNGCMTDKEFKRLSRPQLIEVIYQLKLKAEELAKENEKLKRELDDRRIRIHRAGNIAEAALDINNVLQAAQCAAEQYLNEIRTMRAETEASCKKLLEKAHKEAAAITAKAQKKHGTYDSAIEAILEEYGNTEGERK